jgi:predicted nucleic acid-binding protein
MSVEPGIVDANILIYALDAEAPQHVACRTLLEAAQGEAPGTTLYVTSQILCEFYAIVTNARRSQTAFFCRCLDRDFRDARFPPRAAGPRHGY